MNFIRADGNGVSNEHRLGKFGNIISYVALC